MPNHDYDNLFDAWGAHLNVDPQLGKTVFHLESSGNVGVGKSLPDDPDSPVGPMQVRPSTAAEMAKVLGINGPIDLQDMHFAVPIGMAYIAQGLNTTQSPAGALAYYHGGPDTSGWGKKTQAYVTKAMKLYPTMSLAPPPAVGDQK